MWVRNTNLSWTSCSIWAQITSNAASCTPDHIAQTQHGSVVRWAALPTANAGYETLIFPFRTSHQKYGVPYCLTFCTLKHAVHLDVIWRPTTFSQPILPLASDSLLRLRHNINHLLTYLPAPEWIIKHKIHIDIPTYMGFSSNMQISCFRRAKKCKQLLCIDIVICRN